MQDIVVTLVFSIVMLMFMAFPAMKIVNLINSHKKIPLKWQVPLVIFLTFVLSLLVGVFLRFV